MSHSLHTGNIMVLDGGLHAARLGGLCLAPGHLAEEVCRGQGRKSTKIHPRASLTKPGILPQCAWGQREGKLFSAWSAEKGPFTHQQEMRTEGSFFMTPWLCLWCEAGNSETIIWLLLFRLFFLKYNNEHQFSLNFIFLLQFLSALQGVSFLCTVSLVSVIYHLEN